MQHLSLPTKRVGRGSRFRLTVAELGEMLPWYCSSYKQVGDTWAAEIRDVNDYQELVGDETEADARARTLIYLLEHDRMLVEKGQDAKAA
jgi:hypothetical protein